MIIGEAGVGKSVLSQYLAYCWSKIKNGLWGGLQGRFKAVFWIHLSNLLNLTPGNTVPLAQMLINQCMSGIVKPTTEELKKWLEENSQDALFIVDCFDEAAEAAEKDIPV